MSKQEIKHPDRPETLQSPYSFGVQTDGWLYLSGQGPLDLATGEIKRGSVEEETIATLQNVLSLLEAAGYSVEDVVKCTCYIADIKDFDAFSRTYAQFFPHPRPARTTVQAMLWEGIKVEIDVVARKSGQ